MTWDWEYAIECLPLLLDGLVVTVTITFIASAIALSLGLLIGFVLRVRVRPVAHVMQFIVDFFRGTPLLVQLFFWYYALPSIGISLDAFMVGTIALGLYGAAYTSVVYQAGINNLPKGQWEAGKVLRLPPLALWWDILIPQVFRMVLPSLGNYVVLMFKYTPILTVITVSEMLAKSLDLGTASYRYLEPLTIVGVLFILITLPVVYGLKSLERRMARSLA